MPKHDPCQYNVNIPEYAPCTRASGHDGPCAHPLKSGADRIKKLERLLKRCADEIGKDSLDDENWRPIYDAIQRVLKD